MCAPPKKARRTDWARKCRVLQASKAQQQVLECLNDVKVMALHTDTACHHAVAAHVIEEASCTRVSRGEAGAALIPPSWMRSMERLRPWREMQAFRCDQLCMPASHRPSMGDHIKERMLGVAQEPTRSPLLPGRWRLLYTSRPGTASPIQQTFVGVDAFSVSCSCI